MVYSYWLLLFDFSPLCVSNVPSNPLTRFIDTVDHIESSIVTHARLIWPGCGDGPGDHTWLLGDPTSLSNGHSNTTDPQFLASTAIEPVERYDNEVSKVFEKCLRICVIEHPLATPGGVLVRYGAYSLLETWIEGGGLETTWLTWHRLRMKQGRWANRLIISWQDETRKMS